MLRRFVLATFCALLVCSTGISANASVPAPFASLTSHLRALAAHAPGRVAFDVVDLTGNYHASYDASASMPAASTIKIPVMVEVFRQLQQGRFTLDRHVTLLDADRDYGWGELCEVRAGTQYTVRTLLSKMIDDSDNTATNMLIRLVGRRNINVTMQNLGLHSTHLTTDIRTATYYVRYALRSSPADMAILLSRMAREDLIDRWSSREMIAILEGQEHNSLIPEPLPDHVLIAHKTGTLHDTLDDVGVVYASGAPYVIAVMTTDLPDLSQGRTFIRGVSRIAYAQMCHLAMWRKDAGIETTPLDGLSANSPDITEWLGNGR